MNYKIEELSLGGILDQSIKLMKNRFGLLFGIVVIVYVPFGLLSGFYLQTLLPPQPGMNAPLEQQVAFQQAMAQNALVIFGVSLITILVIVPLMNASVIDAVANVYLGKEASVGDSIKTGFAAILPLFWTNILLGLAVMGGFILLIIPGILFALWFGLSNHVVVLEKINGAAALKRSKQLMKGNVMELIALGLIVGVISYGVNMVAQMIPQPQAAVILNTLAASVTTLFSTTAAVIFYFSCRCKLENFDLEHLAESMGESPEAFDDHDQAVTF